MMKDPNAADELDESVGSDAGEDNAQGGGQGTFFLPPDFLNGKKYKAGDSITLTVVGEDEDGDTEVSLGDGAGTPDDWKTDLKNTLSAKGSEGGQVG